MEPGIVATGRFVAVGRKVYVPDGKWIGTTDSIRAASRTARLLNAILTMKDGVAVCILNSRPERAYRER